MARQEYDTTLVYGLSQVVKIQGGETNERKHNIMRWERH
jgi:hypothetical protein